jgi:hypothetical protein
MDDNKNDDNARALRIFLMTSECHERITNVYENLVDKDFELAKQDLMALISELHVMFDKIKYNDF